jgi:hypothetical protein
MRGNEGTEGTSEGRFQKWRGAKLEEIEEMELTFWSH